MKFRVHSWLNSSLAVASLTTVISGWSFVSDGKNIEDGKSKAANVHEMSELRDLIANAVSKKERELLIPPGIYRGAPEEKSGSVIQIANAKDLHIKAAGVTMLCTRLARALNIENCKNLKISGLTVNYDPVPFTQGDIVKVADDGSWVDVKIHQGYPLKAYSRIDIVDTKSRMRKRGTPYLWGSKAELREAGIVRVTQKDLGSIAKAGDFASMSTGPEPGYACHGIVIGNCDSTVLEDVTVYCAPGFGIVESGGEGNAHFNRVKIIPGPPPEGGTEKPILSTSWDAIQNKICRKGPIVENCVIEDAGDDCWSVQSSDYLILKKDGTTVVVAGRDPWSNNLQAGDSLRSSLHSPEAKIIQVLRKVDRKDAGLDPVILDNLEKAEQWTFWRVGPACLELVLDKPLPFAVGESVYSPDRRGEGYVFRNNTVHGSGRILLKAGNGLIEGNKLTDLHGIMIAPEIPGEAATGLRNITIRNNTLIASGHRCESSWSAQAAAIAFSADRADPTQKGQKLLRDPGIFEDIVIENNIINDSNGLSILVGSAKNVIVKNNRIIGSHMTAPLKFGSALGIDQGCAVYISKCDGVTLENNTVEAPGKFLAKDLLIRDDVVNVKNDGKLK